MLVDQVNKVNNALKATITFVLRDGSKTSLNASITKTWIKLDEEDMHVMVMCGMSAAFCKMEQLKSVNQFMKG